MVGVGIATATAGILVGMVTLTGIGLVMTEIVEFLSGGSIVIMLMLVAVICIVLGTGLPTTANYVVVATLMAPVVVELAAQNDLAVPLIAVQLLLVAESAGPLSLVASRPRLLVLCARTPTPLTLVPATPRPVSAA